MARIVLAILLAFSVTLNGFAASHCHALPTADEPTQAHLHLGGHHHHDHDHHGHSHAADAQRATADSDLSQEDGLPQDGLVIFVSDDFAGDAGAKVAAPISPAAAPLAMIDVVDLRSTSGSRCDDYSGRSTGLSRLLAAHSLRL